MQPTQQPYAQGMIPQSNSYQNMGMSGGMVPQQQMGGMGMTGGMVPQQQMGMGMNAGMVPQQQMGMGMVPQQQMGMGMAPQMGGMGGVPQHGMGMGAHTQAHVPAHAPAHARAPSVIPTKHVIVPVKVSSHHVNNTSDVSYDIEITIEEYFPDGSKAEHKHRNSQPFSDLKKIHDAVHHGELVKDASKLHFPSTHLFERKESDKRVAERMSELKVYLDIVLQSPKALTDRTFIDALKCDRDFEVHLKHTADYMKLMKKEKKKKSKKDSKINKKVEKEHKKEEKKADKFYKKEDKHKEEQYHKALKQQVHADVHGHPMGMHGGMPGTMGAMPGTMGVMPGTMGGMPVTMGAMPATMGAMPGTMGGMPATTPGMHYGGSMSSGH